MRLAIVTALLVLAQAATASDAQNQPATAAKPAASAPAKGAAGAPRIIEMAVTEDGFVPNQVNVKKNEPVQLVITRKTDKTCATELVIKDLGIRQKLPLNQPVAIAFTPSRSGNLRYACGMDMISGTIVVQ